MKPLVLLLLAAATAAVIAPNENLVADGIPDVPAPLADAVRGYSEMRSAFLFDWHPTRHEMLIGTRFAETIQVHLVKMPLGARRQLTFFPDGVDSASFEPAKGEFLVFGKDVGGSEFAQNYRFDLETGAITLLTDGSSKNDLGIFTRQGDRMAYTSTRRNGADTDIWVVDPRDPKTDRMLAEVKGGGWEVRDFTPDGKQLLVLEYESVNESYLWLLDGRSGKRRLLTPRPKKGAEPVSFGGGRFGADGRTAYVTTDRDGDFRRLAALDIATGKIAYLNEDDWDVTQLDVTRDGKLLAYVVNEDGTSVLHVMETATRRQLPLPSLPRGQIFGVRFHADGRTLGFGVVSARTTADVYTIDVEGTLARWTESETGGLSTQFFAEPELVRFPTFDGRTLSAYLYLPPGMKPGSRVPAIIDIHGGPEAQFRPGFLGRANYYLNDLGVALVFPNVRGSSGYGKSFLKLDNGRLREDSVRDIGALLDMLGRRPEIDASRLMVTGGSYGGYMALAAATHFSDRIRCAVDIVGISSFVSFLEHTESYRRDLRRVEYGDERDPAMRAFLLRIAPLTSVDKIQVPMFIVQGQNDPRVPKGEAEQIVAALKKAGVPVWYLLAKDEGHGFAKKKNSDYLFYATIAFIKEHLLQGESGVGSR